MDKKIDELISKKGDIVGMHLMNIEYMKKGKTPYLLDMLYPLCPFEKGKAPVIVFIHGGAWRKGKRNMLRIMDRFINSMREMGCFVASIDYVSKSPQTIIGGAVKNSEKAIDYILKHSETYGYDASKIALYGVSAGGHIALMLALGSKNMPEFSFVLSEFPPTDLVALSNGEAFERSKVLKILPKPILKRLSPINYLNKDIPPMFLLHGTGDSIVHINQTLRFYKKAKEFNDDIYYYQVEGGDHGFLNLSEDDWLDQEQAILKHIKRWFKL